MQLGNDGKIGVGGSAHANRRAISALSGNGANNRPARTHRLFAMLAAFAAIAILPQGTGTAYGQLKGPAAAGITPQWIDDSWRSAQYPSGEWFVGFSMDAMKPNANLAEVRKRVENEARNELAKGISVRVQAASATHTSSVRTTDGKSASETVKKDYDQQILVLTDAEVAKVELTSFHDQANNKVYALAKVRKVDLAAYYVSRVEYYLQNAENSFKLAQQYAASDKKRSAMEQTDAAKKHIEESGKYSDLLSAVDYKGDVKRLLDKGAALLRNIAALVTKLQESALVFITGREEIHNNEVEIVIPKLQSKFSENGCRVADTRDDADYIFIVDAKVSMTTRDANFSYCYAEIRADMINSKTGKSENKLNFTGPKAGWKDEKRACEKAFEEASNTLWKEVQKKTEVCR